MWLVDCRIDPNLFVYQYAQHYLHSIEQYTVPFPLRWKQEMILWTQHTAKSSAYTHSMPLITDNPGEESVASFVASFEL